MEYANNNNNNNETSTISTSTKNNNYNNLSFQCSLHKKKFKFLCENQKCNNSLVCSKCVGSTHKGHVLMNLDESDSNKIKDLVTNFKDYQFLEIQNQFESNNQKIKELDEINESTTAQSKQDEDKIIKMFSEIRNSISNTEDKYINHIEENNKKNTETHSNFKNELVSINELINQINNKYKNKETLNNINFKDITQITEIIHCNNISKSIVDQPDIFNFKPINNENIINECQSISNSIALLVSNTNKINKIENLIINGLKIQLPEDIDELPEFFEYGDKNIPYLYYGYKDYSKNLSTVAINFNYCSSESFQLNRNLTEVHLVGGNCYQLINSLYRYSKKYYIPPTIYFHNGVESQSTISISNSIKILHLHKYLPHGLSFPYGNSLEIHIYDLDKPIDANLLKEYLHNSSLHIHKEYKHQIPVQSFPQGFLSIYLYDLKQPLQSIPNTINIYLNGYRHPIKHLVSSNCYFYKEIPTGYQQTYRDSVL